METGDIATQENVEFLSHTIPRSNASAASQSELEYRKVESWPRFLGFLDALPITRLINSTKSPISQDDLPAPYDHYNIEEKVANLNEAWKDEVQKSNPSFVKTVCRVFKGEFFLSIALLLTTCTCHLVTTVLLGKIIDMITQLNLGETISQSQILPLATYFAIFYFLAQFLETWIGFYDYVIGAKLRLAITGLIYKKVNDLPSSSVSQVSAGKIINIIANDLNDVDFGYGFVWATIFSPYNVFIACYVMWGFFGWYTVFSVVCLVGFQLLATHLSNQSEKPRQEKNAITDERIKSTKELIECARLIKQYVWEKSFQAAIHSLRKREAVELLKLGKIEAIGRTFTETSVYLCTFVTCLIYVIGGGCLSAEKVYASMMILNFIKMWAILFFHLGRMFIVNVKVTRKRIEEVMTLKDVSQYGTDEGKELNEQPQDIIFDNFAGYWNQEGESSCLRDINVRIPVRKLTAIIGKVGSGKSSFLKAILKELPKTQGKLIMSGKIAYVEQEPIIFSGTISDNILFGRPYQKDLYHQVLKSTGLYEDLKQMPEKDNTIVGERGVTLSGGQKTRLSLARALYTASDIYLLDDPFSALDIKLANYVMENVVKGMLKNKTVIMVTHNLQFAKQSDKILVFDQATIVAQGSFEDLLNERHESIESLLQEKQESKPIEDQRGPFDLPADPSHQIIEDEMKIESALSKKLNDQLETKILIDGTVNEKVEEKLKESKPEENLVTWQTYKDYLTASNETGKVYGLLGVYILSQVFIIAFTRYLGYWASLQNQAFIEGDEISNIPHIFMATVLTLGIFLSYRLKITMTISFITSINSTLHEKMLSALVKSTIKFFDYTPSGQIINRFSNDLGILDKQNWENIFDFLDGMIYIGMFLIYLCWVSPFMLIPSFILTYALYRVKQHYTKPVIEMKRVDLASRSPLYTEISSTLNGLLIIRIYQQGANFVRKFFKLVYDNSRAFLYNARSNRLFIISLKIFLYLLLVIGIFSYIYIAFHTSMDSGLFGVVLLYLIEIANKSVWAIRQTLFLDINFQSAQRVLEYTRLEPEEDSKTTLSEEIENLKREKWPKKGEIEFKNVSVKYTNDSNPALKNVSFTVKPMTKVAIVGRSGSGKSTIVQALFRLVNIQEFPESSIKIDGVDIKTLELEFLRKNLCIIPQTPTIFTGTVRRNLDPLNEFEDYEIWDVLAQVELRTYIEGLEKQLNTDITMGSSVFSTGQKQLICLARALLKKSSIVVLDEPTSNIDPQTEKIIQKNLKQYFNQSTIITIAHRLQTVADADMVLVMHNGRLVECGNPYEILVKNIGDQEITNKDGKFAQMVIQQGEALAKDIFINCLKKYEELRLEK